MHAKCFAVRLERYEADGLSFLSLHRLTVGEFAFGVPWVNHSAELARKTLESPGNRYLAMEIDIELKSVKVFLDGELVWEPLLDEKTLKDLGRSEGLVGIVGNGKSAMFRDVAVKFGNE